MSESVTTAVPEYLSPAALGEYISYNQCARFAKHRLQEVEGTDAHGPNEFREAFEPLNILFSAAGDEFETDVTSRADDHTRETVDLTDPEDLDDDVFRDNHAAVLQHIRTAVQAPSAWNNRPLMLFQASLAGTINGQGVRGDSDNIFIWSTEDGAEVRIVDIKRTTEQKVYHQVQAATYAAILRQLIEQDPELSTDDVSLSGGVITQETAVTPLTKDNIPAFDIEPRIADIHRLVESGSSLMTALQTDTHAVEFQLDSKCDTCPYNEGCVTESFEQADIRLLGLTVSQQQTLREHGVQTLADVAALCRTPDEQQWRPTEYPDGTFKSDTYQALARTPGIGELLPHLVYRAESMLDALQAQPQGISDRPQNWLPGSGRCSLPDDEPSDEAPGTHEFQHGSMVRVYLNVQYDHLRDRLIQLSARVTATGSDAPPERISVLTDGAPEDTETAHAHEAALFNHFYTRLVEGIRTVADGLSLEAAVHDDPPVHFYLYTQHEYDALVDAFDRHPDEQAVGALRSTLEGVDRPDDAMVSVLRPEVESHIILETPSPGLLHAYQEVHPGQSELYSKPRSRDAWSYSPPDSKTTYDLRHVFSRRLFDVGAAASYPDEQPDTLVREAKQRLRTQDEQQTQATGTDDREFGIAITPDESDRYDGLNTRMRHGASIPLAYQWAAVGRIDDDWANKDSVDESALAEFELNRYRYRDDDQDEELTPDDVETLGKHLCDVLEHVERSLRYKDSLFTKAPYPLGSLTADTFEPPTLAEGVEQYLAEEYEANREEKYQLYRKFPLQRILSGESIPVYVTDIEERNRSTIQVDGILRYDDQTLFGDGADRVKRACRQKGAQGTSSGSWMVANPFHPGAVGTEVTQPYVIEGGANATVEHLDTDSDSIRLSLRNFWNDGSEFGQRHAKWTTDSDRANEDNWLYVDSGEWLILDPQTDDITAERVQQALDHAETNALHQRLEAIRHGHLDTPTTPLFSVGDDSSAQQNPDGADAVASWLRANVDADTYPSERQQRFITETRRQFVALQGPPGTGKTAATMAPTLLARLYAGARNGVSVNGLVTAPSNTAIDELLADTAELLGTAEEEGPLGDADLDIELVRIGEQPEDPIDGVTYVNYNNDEHAGRVREITQRLQTVGSPPIESTGASQAESTSSESDYSVAGDEQSALSTFGARDQGHEDTNEESGDERWTTDEPLTLVFATTTRSWRFLKEIAPGSNPDNRELAEQRLWHLLAVDEASMLELPNFLLAGSALRENGQVLVGGDHRQLPPVQKRDWSEVSRRDIRSTAAYLSTLDYMRFLRGDDVLDDEQESWVACERDSDAIEIPLVQLDTTYRFDEWTAQFMQQTIYEKDGIPYSSGREPEPVPAADEDLDGPFGTLFDGKTTVALLTYSGEREYRQWNPVESVLTEALIMATAYSATLGVVTPHNAQRGRVQSLLQERGYTVGSEEADADDESGQDIQVETVNRFQGGERDLMAVNATVSDPNYIAAEDEFLLTENRINVSFTRHRDLLIVLAPETLLGYLPDDPELYDQATLWKSLAMELGEAPGNGATEYEWQGDLGEVLAAVGMESVGPMIRPELPTTITLYTNTSQ